MVLVSYGGWAPDDALVERWETDVRPGFNYHEDRVPDYDLPEVLKTFDGEVITLAEEWMEHRDALLKVFREQMFGIRAGDPDWMDFRLLEEDSEAMDGAATLKRVLIISSLRQRDFRFELTLFLPNDREGPVALFLLMNNRGRENTDPTRKERSDFWPAEAVIARGYGVAAIQNAQLAPDNEEHYRTGVMRLIDRADAPRAATAWGALAAWGWGASRAMDYFEKDPAIDAERIAVLGHSRGGKAALWAGAEDSRFSLVISNNSGCGGAALSRRKFGETIAEINRVFPFWFTPNFHEYGGDGIDRLPIDQHQLIALIAPRAVYVASADEDLWADPRGEFMSLAHASPVYELFSGEFIDPAIMPSSGDALHTRYQGYHLRPGDHNLTLFDWDRFMDFADQLYGEGETE